MTKEAVKKILPPLVVSLAEQRHDLKLLKHYLKGKKAVAKKKHSADDKIKIVFVMSYVQSFNSVRSIYEAALNDENAQVMILCIPDSQVRGEAYSINKSGSNSCFDYCRKLSLAGAVNAYDEKSKTWFDLKAYSPDYVFYTRPYYEDYPKRYMSCTVCQYAKCCYMAYAIAYTANELALFLHSPSMLIPMYITFYTSKELEQYCNRRFALERFIHSNKYVCLGYPVFDLLSKQTQGDGIKRITWYPRWAFSKIFDGQMLSNFVRYVNPIMQYMQNHPELHLTVRPHPLMFSTMEKEGVMSAAEIEALKNKMLGFGNVELDESEDFIPSINDSDVLISDFSALVGEYFVTGKPVIYCNETDGFNGVFSDMINSCYHADNWHEAETTLESLINGNDPKKAERERVIGSVLPENAGRIGADIYSYIKSDFYR